MSIERATLMRTVQTALEEDLGRGDLTTEACVDAIVGGRAELRAREPLVFCGAEVACEVYRQVDPALQVQAHAADGARLEPGEVALAIAGPAASILKGERVALNFVQAMSAVATHTRRHVEAVPEGCALRIADTRKTLPGLRALQRHAVRCGGGHNHRYDLSSAVLIKDNHIAACGGVGEAVRRARAQAPHTSRICCEVDRAGQIEEALEAGADVLLLDNFDDAELPQVVAQVAGRAICEVSGRVRIERIAAIARAGVDVVSIGALTHSAPSVDLGLDWIAEP
ncbi:MAG: carboxylating nicotinate-nucleotide diphosphorylase [Myxococcales bacterium]|nr:carboxylating nicotinate-nucleotide diphosphorylase [Myxococcales bacterium]